MKATHIKYEIIGRGVLADKSDLKRHYIKLLYRGDGTPWWVTTAGLDLMVPEEFEAQAGDFVIISITKCDPA